MKIKAVSLNIWFGGKLLNEAADFLKQQNADLIFVQEAFNGQSDLLEARYRTVQELKRRVGLPFESFKPDFSQPDKSAVIGNLILSRFPIEEVEHSSLNHDVFYNLQHCQVHTPTGVVDALNIHGVWDLNGDNFSYLRKKMSQDILRKVKGKESVILAGDTNAKPTNRAIAAIGEQLHNVFGDDLITTFNMRHKENPGYAAAAVDTVFVSPSITVVSRACLNVNVSDHLPLVTTLELV